jgi:glyoxylase-like metal-dependent hydrolase (beta-lactamase superfamily II)
MVKVEKFVFNPFQVNTYIIYNDYKEAFITDPACFEEEEKQQLSRYIDKNELKVKAIVNTHCHIDHILGVEYIRNKYNTEFWCSAEDQFLIDNAEAQGEFYGLRLEKPNRPERYISDNEIIYLGNDKIAIFHVPGHSPGSLLLYLQEEKILISGDVLFSGSIGRTDLPGGDYQTLVSGIRKKILQLGDEIEVFPGHGPSTTIGKEKLTNPFLQ